MMKKCKLCQRDKKLCKKSHIYPKFMYVGMFEDNESYLIKLKIGQKGPEKERGKIRSKGVYDPDILCQGCEKIINEYEDYVAKELFTSSSYKPKNTNRGFKGSDEVYRIEISNLDYRKFKLFQLSILWRAHHSKHEVFEEVDLGKYEPILRDMVYNGKAGNESEFQSFWIHYGDRKISTQGLATVRKFYYGGKSITYSFHLNHTTILFKVSNHKHETFDLMSINKSGVFKYFDLRGKRAKNSFEKTTGLDYF